MEKLYLITYGYIGYSGAYVYATDILKFKDNEEFFSWLNLSKEHYKNFHITYMKIFH